MKQFSDRIKFEKFKPVRPDLSYSAFDPELSINGQRMQFLLGKNNDGSYATDDFKKSHFKMLGRYISFEVNEKGVKAKIRSDVISDLDKLDGTLVDGPKKLRMYQHYAIARVSWPFLVYDLDLSFAQELTKRATSKLKKWAGLASSSEVGVLYRAKKDFGLGITSLEDHYKRMQLVKCDLLKNSGSDDVRLLFQAKANKEGKEGRMWRASRLHTEREIEAKFKLKFPSQSSRLGLGNGAFKAKPTNLDTREEIKQAQVAHDAHARILRSLSLKMQGAWLAW